jgi:hypothetical protein
VDDTLRARFGALQEQRLKKAQAGMMPSQEQLAQMQQAAQTPMPANQQGTPEDAEFKAFMKRNPKVASRYVELTRKMGTLMQQGKFDEADAVDEELQKLVDSNPELAALQRREEERSAAASAAGQAQENSAMANSQKQQDQAIWGTGLEYLKAADKEDYSTLIVIDRAFHGDEKDYSRDRTVLEKETAGWAPHQEVWEFSYAGNQATTAAKSTNSQAQQPEKTEPESATGKVGDTLKKGFKALKGLW